MNELFGEVSSDEVIELNTSDCVPYHNHKFNPKRSNFDELRNSIQSNGVLMPLIVRPYKGKYEIIAGHRRYYAASEIGLATVPVIVKNLTDNEAWVIVSETNINQSAIGEMLPSEIAEVLYDYHKAIKAQGKRTDLIKQVQDMIENETSLVGEKSELEENHNSAIATGKSFDMSSRNVSRYLSIYKLTDSLKKLLDEGKIPLYGAVELSHIDHINQDKLSEIIIQTGKISMKQAEQIRSLYEDGVLDYSSMMEVVEGKKNLVVKKTSGFGKMKKLYQQYFTNEQSQDEVEMILQQALERYFADVNKQA